MKNLKKEQKLIVYIIITLSIMTLLLIVIYKAKYFENTHMPTISNEIEEAEYYNSYIKSLYDSAKKLDNVKISYKKYNSMNYISYVFKINIKNKSVINNYLTLVIDKENNKVLSLEEIASRFGYELDKIESIIRMQLRSYYKDEVKKEYINSNECNFDCYLYKYREIENMSSIYSLSIENKKLIIYFNLNKTGNVDDTKYFEKYNNPSRIEINLN